MKEKLITFLLIFSLTVNLAALITIGYFWGKSDRPGETAYRGSKPPLFVNKLPLNNGQRRKMLGARRALLEEIAPIKDELMTKREELVNLLTIETPDRDAIDKKLSEINGLQLKTQRVVIDQLLKQKGFLSPVQQKEYFDLISKRICQGRGEAGKGSGGHRGRGMGRGKGMGRGQEEGMEGMGMGRGKGQGGRMRR